MIKEGKVLQGYRVVERLGGAGKSEVGRGVKIAGGQTVFIKRLMSPKYPAPGIEAARAEKGKQVCARFEEQQRDIMKRLEIFTNGSGHLIKPIDFFRIDLTYYKVYPFVVSDDLASVRGHSAAGKAVFLKTLALALRELHVRGIVHCDLKPDNVLVQRTKAGPIAKLIDFDESFVAGKPPERGMSGDPLWFSPEREQLEDELVAPTDVGLASDIFTFVLVAHSLLHGSLPEVTGSTRSGSVAERVIAGGEVRLTDLPGAPREFNDLARKATAAAPADRPTIEELCRALGLPPSERSRVISSMPTPR